MEELPSLDIVREIRHRARRIVSDQNSPADQGWANFVGLLRALPVTRENEVGGKNELVNRIEQNGIFGSSSHLVDPRSSLAGGRLLRNESQKLALIVILIALATYTFCIAVLLVRHMRRDLQTTTWRRNRHRPGYRQRFFEQQENTRDEEEEEHEEYVEEDEENERNVQIFNEKRLSTVPDANKAHTIVELDTSTAAGQCFDKKLNFPRLLYPWRLGSIKRKTRCLLLGRNKTKYLPNNSSWTSAPNRVSSKSNRKRIERSECYL